MPEGEDEEGRASSVAPAAGASTAGVRSRPERRVSAESAWKFSRGKTESLGSYEKLGGLVFTLIFG